MGWEQLKGCSRLGAFKLIEIKHDHLSKEQKDRLWRYWEQNKEALDISYWGKSNNWDSEKVIHKQDKLLT